MLPRSSPAQPSTRWRARSRADAQGPYGWWSRRTKPTGGMSAWCTPHPAIGADTSRSCLATASRLRAPRGDGCASSGSAHCATVCMSGAGCAAAGLGCRHGRVRARSSAAKSRQWLSGGSPESTCARGASRTSGNLWSKRGCVSGTGASTGLLTSEAWLYVAPCVRLPRGDGTHGCRHTRMRSRIRSLSRWLARLDT